MGRKIVVDKEKDIAVRQPKISDVVDMGENEYNELVLPYVLTTESIFNGVENEEELINRFHFFELFFIKVENGGTILDNVFNGKSALDVLSDSIQYFLDADDIKILEKRQKIIVNDSYMIDKDEFDRIRKVIQGVVGRGDVEVEKPPKNMTKRQKDIWMKLQKGRRRNAEKNAVYLQDMINFTAFGGSSYIPFDKIDEMSYFQLMNAYKSIVGMDAYNMGMQYKLSQKFDVKDDIKHWTDTIKIGK